MAGGEVSAGKVGVGSSSLPSRPVSPWMLVGAWSWGRVSAWAAPM